MMIPSNYSINISSNTGDTLFGSDEPRYVWFATVELGQAMQGEAFEKLAEFRKRFPAPEYKCTLSHVKCSGHDFSDAEVDAYMAHAAK